MLREPARRLVGLVLIGILAVGLAGCSDDAPPREPNDAVQGKTPVVRPEDVHRKDSGGAAVLAPDYRRDLAAGMAEEEALDQAAPVPAKPAAASPRLGGAAAPSAIRTEAKIEPEPEAPLAPSMTGATGGFPVTGCRQLVVIVASDFDATRGTLRRFTRAGADAPWREAGSIETCALGRGGLAVGRGLTPPFPGPTKHEGDGRTPAGLFSLPEAFGYAAAETARTAGVRLPYVAVDDKTSCVTDPDSRLWGRIVGPEDRPAKGRLRQDRMVRNDGANVWGLVIGHNRQRPVPGAGSCVFLNVRPAGGPPTGGGIGCPESVTAALVAWLDPAAEPVLAVLPQKQYQEVKTAWGLP